MRLIWFDFISTVDCMFGNLVNKQKIRILREVVGHLVKGCSAGKG